MIISSSNQLTFVDWESAVLAPPERDAFVYMDYLGLNAIEHDFSAFNAGYQMIHTEPMQWHTNWLSYYAYRIQLRNLASWLHKLLHEPLDDLQCNHDMYLIEHHCLDRLENVERIARALTEYNDNGCIE